ncbi:hypothetical protein Dimus_009294 [Dionaea muscipula]
MANPSKKRKETTNPKTSIEIVNRFIGYEYVHLQEEERTGRNDPVESFKSKAEYPLNKFRGNTEAPQRRQVEQSRNRQTPAQRKSLKAASLKHCNTNLQGNSSDT